MIGPNPFRQDPSKQVADPETSEELFEELLGSYASDIRTRNSLGFLNKCKLIGKYQIQGLLGIGGQAICLLARDEALDRLVVIKLYPQGLSDDRKDQILREGRALAKIRSPHVAQCHGCDWFEGRPYLVLEYVEGETLTEWASRYSPTPDRAKRITEQLAEGIDAVHKAGLLHLDLKPCNVIVDADGNAILIDFGLSEEISGPQPTRIAGSPSFLAPERMENAGVDCRTDIYGIGGILFFLITGRAPFEGESKADVLEKIARLELDLSPLDQSLAPKQLIDACKQCLSMDREQRPSSATKLKQLVQRRQWGNSMPMFAFGSLIVAALLTGFIGSFIWEQGEPDKNLFNAKPAVLVAKADLPKSAESLFREMTLRIADNLGDPANAALHHGEFDVSLCFSKVLGDSDSSELLEHGQSELKEICRWNLRDDRPPRLQLEEGVQYVIRGEASCPCYFAIYSGQYGDGSNTINEFKDVFSDGHKKFGTDLSWIFRSTTSPGHDEVIWIVASTLELDRDAFARAVVRQLDHSSRADGSSIAVTDIYRGVEEVTGKSIDDSELLIADTKILYRVESTDSK